MKQFSRYLDPGRRHPFMLVSADRLRQIAQAVFEQADPLRQRAFHSLRDQCAQQAADEGGAQRSSRRALGVAVLAALHAAAGRSETAAGYAADARATLLRLAEAGPGGPVPGYGYLRSKQLIPLAWIYDLIWDLADWSAAERDLLERFFRSSVEERLASMHEKHLSNHAAWCLAQVAAVAFLYGDAALAGECLDGPDSYADRIAHQFFDDGMSYEQSSWTYHNFSVEPLFYTALSAAGAGAEPDPFRLKVPNNLSLAFRGGSTGDYDMPHYPADTAEFPRPREKDFHLALTAWYELLRPDLTVPEIGDYGQRTPLVSDHWMIEIAWDFYGDERAAWLLAREPAHGRSAESASIVPSHLLPLLFGRPLPSAPRFAPRSVIYPQAGYAVLKSVEDPRYWSDPALYALMKFGPFGNGHGHADKLHIDLACGRDRCISEELVRQAVDWKYYNSTVSHNSVTVGGQSQPGNEGMFALNNSCGRLVFRHFTPDLRVACAEAPDVCPGLRVYRRTLALTRKYLLDIFEVEADRETVFDWFLHGRQAVEIESATLSPGRLGFESDGYEFFRDVRRGVTAGPFAARFDRSHAVWFPDGAEVFTAIGPWKADAGRSALIVRKRGQRAVFLAVHDPFLTGIEEVKLDVEAGGRGVLARIRSSSAAEPDLIRFDRPNRNDWLY